MKKSGILFFIFFMAFFPGFAGILVIEGQYQDKNLYVQNGYSSTGVGFCTYEVTVNGKITTDEVNSSAFEIDFAAMQIKSGTTVIVELKHKDDCSPKILNPDALKPRATFEVTNIFIDNKGLLKWSTKNEMGSLPYIVEQFRWNKWIPVGEVRGTGSLKENNYTFQTTFHSGENKFRVKQIGFGGVTKASSNVSIATTEKEPTFQILKKELLQFSSETMYEVYDIYGNVIKRGFGKEIALNNLTKGHYYLCYDNVMSDFKKP